MKAFTNPCVHLVSASSDRFQGEKKKGGKYAGWTRELRQGRTLHTPLNKFVKGTGLERKGGTSEDGRADGRGRQRAISFESRGVG